MAELKEGMVGGALNVYFIYKFLRILTTPWESTDAFKLGIVDEKGAILRKKRTLLKIEEKEAYTMMHRLVWKLKRLMEKVPFGKSRLASYAAALWLIKEEKNFHDNDKELQESFLSFLETDWKNNALILKEKYEGDMDKKTFSTLRKEGIDIEKSSMKDVIKDFQNSDAPQFKGKSDKKKKEMAIAAKLSKEEVEIEEGTWAMPDSQKKYDQLMKLMQRKIPAGKAAKILYNFTGDDALFDAIGEKEKEDKNGDVRPMVNHFLELPDVIKYMKKHGIKIAKPFSGSEEVEVDEKKMPADLKRKQQDKRKKWQALGKKNPDKVYARGYYKRF